MLNFNTIPVLFSELLTLKSKIGPKPVPIILSCTASMLVVILEATLTNELMSLRAPCILSMDFARNSRSLLNWLTNWPPTKMRPTLAKTCQYLEQDWSGCSKIYSIYRIFPKPIVTSNKMEHTKGHISWPSNSCPFSWHGLFCSDCS